MPRAGSIELRGGFAVAAPPAEAFELFSPAGERLWVPDWDPEPIHPPGAAWERGQVFRTQEERGEAVWIVTVLDRERHHVEYHRVEPGRYLARVSVSCASAGEGATEVQVTYAFVGLSETGNADIAQMSQDAFAGKMRRWEGWIGAHLAGRGAAKRDG